MLDIFQYRTRTIKLYLGMWQLKELNKKISYLLTYYVSKKIENVNEFKWIIFFELRTFF